MDFAVGNDQLQITVSAPRPSIDSVAESPAAQLTMDKLELARAGSGVILAARTETKGQDAVDRIQQLLPQARVRFG
jgi:hypothetical protein